MNEAGVKAKHPRISLAADEKRRLILMFGFIALLHIGGALLMWAATSDRYQLSDGTLFGWGTALLAYTLGMRHAFRSEEHTSELQSH